jgi:hypothetical protein
MLFSPKKNAPLEIEIIELIFMNVEAREHLWTSTSLVGVWMTQYIYRPMPLFSPGGPHGDQSQSLADCVQAHPGAPFFIFMKIHFMQIIGMALFFGLLYIFFPPPNCKEGIFWVLGEVGSHM